MRVIGLDVSRTVAEAVYLEDGLLRPGGRVGLRRTELEKFASELGVEDHVVLEATGNTHAIVHVPTSIDGLRMAEVRDVENLREHYELTLRAG